MIRVPAIPIPLDRSMLGYRCPDCGDTFRHLDRQHAFHRYQIHWLQHHSVRGRDGAYGSADDEQPHTLIAAGAELLRPYLDSGLWTADELQLQPNPQPPVAPWPLI